MAAFRGFADTPPLAGGYSRMTTRPDPALAPGVQVYALARQRQRPMLHGLVFALILFGAFSSIFISKTFPFQLNESAPVAGLSLPRFGAAAREQPVLTSDALPVTVRREEMSRALRAFAGEAVGD